MSFRFWQRIRLAPGVTLNLSKSGGSLSFGPQGAKYTIGPRGRRATVGLPGTGLFYTVETRNRDGRRPEAEPAAPPDPPHAARDRLDLGFLRRLATPREERDLVEGLRAHAEGDEAAALAALERGADLPDAAWMAGMLRLRRGDHARARAHLETALAAGDRLGALLDRYGVAAEVAFPVTPEIEARARPCERGTRLALIEIAQAEGRMDEARAHLDRLVEMAPDDPVARLSFAELAMEAPGDREMLERAVALTAETPNETAIDTAALLHRGRALAALGLPEAAVAVFTTALRRRRDRPEALLRRIRWERARLDEDLGRRARARRDLERIYAEDPGFEDVAARLELGG